MGAVLKLTTAEQTLLQQLPKGDVAARLREHGLPGRRKEGWRWSDLRSVLKEPIALSDPYAGTISPTALILENAGELIFANGRLVGHPSYLPPQIRISRQSAHLGTPGAPLAAIASELSDGAHIVEIVGKLPSPVLIRYLSDGSGMHQTRVQVRLAPDTEATIIEHHESTEGAWLSNNLCEFSLNSKSHLTRIVVQEGAPGAIGAITGLVMLGDRATYTQIGLGFGGKMVRDETQIVHVQRGAKAKLSGAYLLDDKNHLDNTTRVEHRAIEGLTEELYKGVLRGQSRGVFQGKFFVARDAQKTDARMSHHALLLSENAEVNAKPELEIYADDVQCAHGNTVGSLDENVLFYMRQRGMSENEARAILVDAFVGEVLEGIKHEQLREQLVTKVRDFMGGGA